MEHVGTVEIQTERLVLRRFRKEDAEALFCNYGSDPLVRRYISFAPCQTREGAEGFIGMHLECYRNDPDFYGWAITLRNEVIGSIGLFRLEHETDSCELGYSIGSRWWGQGIATEAVRAVLRFAFDRIGAHRIFASHHVENTASGRVLLKAGMRQEGILRDGQKNPDGTYSDLILYAVLSTDRLP